MNHANGTSRASAASAPVDQDEKAYQRLWFALARTPWSSLVMVPADPRGSADQAARALAEVGKRLCDVPVTAVTTGSLEYGTAVALADLPQFVDRRRQLPASRWPTVDVEATPAEAGVSGPAGAPADGKGEELMMVTSGARIIISVPAVISEPLGLATTMSADAVVICIEMGRTKVADARRTLELIGRDRVSGCFLIR